MCPAQRTLEDPRRIQQGSILRQHDLRDSIIHAESSLDLTQLLHYRRNGGIVSAPAPIPSGRLHPCIRAFSSSIPVMGLPIAASPVGT